MIQLSTLPQTGVIPGARVAGVPQGIGGDFALVLADLAGVTGVVAAPAAAAGDTEIVSLSTPAERQPLAVDGKDMPIANPPTAEVATVPGATTAGSAIARPVAVGVGTMPSSPTEPAVVADAPTAMPTIGRTPAARVRTPMPPPTPPIAETGALPASDEPVPESITVALTLGDAPVRDVRASPRRTNVALAQIDIPVVDVPAMSIPAGRAVDTVSEATVPIGDPTGVLVVPTPAVTMSIFEPPPPPIAAPPPRSGKADGGTIVTALPIKSTAMPAVVKTAPPPIDRAAGVAVPISTAALPDVAPIVTRPAAPLPAAIPAIATAQPVATIVPPPPIASAAHLAVPSPVPVATVPATPAVSATPIVVTPDLVAPTEFTPAVSVTVTVVAPAAAPPPTPQSQPAAQAFAAAMFAAGAPVETKPAERSDDLSFAIGPAVASNPFNAAVPTIAPTSPGQQPTLDLTKSDWMASMIDRIETLRDDSGGVRETRMKLSPEALGGIEVSVRRDESGAIQVRIAADTAQARALLTEAAPRLAEMAEARGVKLGGSSVDAGAGSADQGRRDAQAAVPAERRAPPPATADATDIITDTRLA